jgi:Carboxypeptidase regulatory-like domain
MRESGWVVYLGSRSLLALVLGVPAVMLPLASPRAMAQAVTGSIAGHVVDAHGAAVPDAEVVVRNTDVSLERKVHSDRTGGFRVSGLSSGAYTVEAHAKGLALKRPVRLTLTLGSSTEVVLKLDVAAVKQSTTVTARRGTVEGNTVAPAANTSEASVGSFLPGLTVTYLPNRDRDFTQFMSQAAGALEDADGAGVILAGQRSNAIATQVDGTSFNDPLLGGRRGAADGGLFLPLTAVREFEVVRTGVDASVGQTNAGLINVATKAGANRPRGEAFYTGRPTPLTAADAFGHSLDSLQNAFGISYGGPIKKDKVFYLVSFEQDFVHAPYFAQFAPQVAGTVVPAALLAQQGQIVEKQSPTGGFGRVDWVVNAKNTLSAELGLNRVNTMNAGDSLTRSLTTLGHAASFTGQSFTSRVGLTTVLSARAFNQAVVAWSSDHRNRTPNSSAPEFFINGFGGIGGDSAGRHLYTSQQTQVIDDVTLSRGRNEFAVGGRFAAAPAYEEKELNLNGRFDYDSLADYLNNNPRRFQQTFVTGNDIRYQGTVGQLGLYGNARLQLRTGLFLTAGLRWAGQWNPQPGRPNAALAVTQRVPNDLKQWQPRVGLAWSADAKTVVRASAGLYGASTPATYFHRTFVDNGTQTVTADSYFDPELIALTGGNTSSPHALSGAPTGLAMPNAFVAGVAAGFRNPMSFQAAASVDRQVMTKLELTVGYLRNSTWGLERRLDENLNVPTVDSSGTPIFPIARPIAGVGRLVVEQSTAHSTYDGGFISVNSQISRRSQLLVNYTVSRSVDDASGSDPYAPVTAVNPYALRQERADSLFDARQQLNLNAIFNLPVGFKLNPLFVARSGLPYTPIVGFDTQNDANDWNARAVVNGVAVGRNSSRQPAFSNLDLRLVKDFTFKGEGHHLDLFMDVFNVVGAQNLRFDDAGVSLFGDASHPVYSAGMPLFAPGVTRLGGPREVQFTVRLVGF